MFEKLKSLFSLQKTSKKEKIISAILFFGYIFGLGYASKTEPGIWYETLNKSALNPPDVVCSIVWLVLFALIGLSGYFVWNYYQSEIKRKLFTLLYLVNGVLVYLWSDLFFVQHNITGTLYMILGIMVIVELMIITAFGNKKKAAYLLLPYLAWILFATYLNTTIIILN